MPYTNLINKIISDKKLSTTDIINEFKKLDITYSRSYINKILRGECEIPSNEFSNAISKICDVDNRLLLIEASFDRCDNVIKEFIYIMLSNALINCSNILINEFPEDVVKSGIEMFKKEFPIAQFLIYILEDKTDFSDFNYNGIKTKDGHLQFDLSDKFELTVEDNSMSPIINKNDKFKILFKEKYNDMDIVYVHIKKYDTKIIRRAIFKGDKITLYAENKLFEPITYNKNEIDILGKVARIMRNF